MSGMDRKEDQGTDAASIKPVSSLRSHFEALKTPSRPARDDARSREPASATSLEAPRPNFPLRVSLDLPRPASPWRGESGPYTPQTPVDPQKGRVSPPKTLHKRPQSMHLQSSPVLTPAVNVESPRSPPQSFFQRSSSRSPERIDNTPFGKVRELVSQHSSRDTTRAPTPVSEKDVFLTKPRGQEEGRPLLSRSPSRQPPPVNRAEKPKMPAKPLLASQQNAGRLTPEPQSRRPSVEAKVSPFSTPPSSNENSPSESPPLDSVAKALALPSVQASSTTKTPQPVRSSLEIPTPSTQHNRPTTPMSPNGAPRPIDPRFMGFSSAKVGSEREDPRMLGFSDASKPAAAEPPPAVPTRANTVTEKPMRDARDLGFSTSRPAQRAVSETIKQTPLPPSRPVPPPAQQPATSHTAPTRDARQFGFSNTSSAASREGDVKPDLPVRRVPMQPPPRPSDASKPGVKPLSAPSLPQRMSDTSARVDTTSRSKTTMLPATDINFPPPPKRSTFNEEDTLASDPMIRPVSRSTTLDSYQSSKTYNNDSDEAEEQQQPSASRTDYPDTTHANRRPPFNLEGPYEINVRSDPRVFDVCGRYLCVSGYATRVFDMDTGESIMGISHGETVKITAARFKPGKGLEDEGARIWLGNNIGDLQEIDVNTHSVVGQSSAHNRREIIRIIRYRRHILTLDDEGKLFVWRANDKESPSLRHSPVSHKIQRGHTFSMVVLDKLWVATGKEVRVYRPGNEAQFSVLSQPLSQAGNGDVTSGTFSNEKGGRVYLGHIDGKITIYSANDYAHIASIKASDYKINGLSFVGDRLWAAYKTGKVYVYDTSVTPWKVMKDWKAHEGPAHGMLLDPSSVWSLQRLQVVTAGHDNHVRLWDATLEEDWIENKMRERDVEYCTFRELRVAVITWNVGAVVPAALRNDFIADAIHAEDPPDIVVFGFQEVVDLEDRAVTAKSLLGFGKKKESAKSEQYQSRVYRDWRDYLARCLGRFTSSQISYSEVRTSSLVGLFQCVFIRQDEFNNLSMIAATNVKCGMGGHYGNKGALVTRFVLDHSSVCFTNCHLAAGQTQTSSRNNDIACILEADTLRNEKTTTLPAEGDRRIRGCFFVGGGDGTQILDHEICILNGDLNYRIDSMPRKVVIKMIQNNELGGLLKRDQIMVCRQRVAGFRLSAFSELPIAFAPTYKYDPGTDNYDSSEKQRVPAWCDRLLYRGPGRIKQLEYRRHEVKVSDHRPVSGIFKIRVKKVNAEKREKVMDQCHRQFESVKREMAQGVCVRWLVDVWGMTDKDARRMLISS